MNSMVFNPMNLVMESVSVPTDINSFVSRNESYFDSAINFTLSIKEELNNNSKELYKSIMESCCDEDINKCFNNFFNKAKKLIDEFIKFIKSLYVNFTVQINKYMEKDDKNLKKAKEILKKFDDAYSFDYDAYTFTFSPSIPVINALAAFNSEFMGVNIEGLSQATNSEKYAKVFENINNRYKGLLSNLENGWYDKFRAQVLGDEDGSITSDNFDKALFSVFRDGKTDTDVITVNKSYLDDICDRIKTYNDLTKECKAIIHDIEQEYNDIRKQIESVANRNIDKNAIKTSNLVNGQYVDGFVLNDDILSKINLFMKAKLNQVQQMSSIHSLAFAAKLEAISCSYKQDRDILYKAMYRCVGAIDKKEAN